MRLVLLFVFPFTHVSMKREKLIFRVFLHSSVKPFLRSQQSIFLVVFPGLQFGCKRNVTNDTAVVSVSKDVPHVAS